MKVWIKPKIFYFLFLAIPFGPVEWTLVSRYAWEAMPTVDIPLTTTGAAVFTLATGISYRLGF